MCDSNARSIWPACQTIPAASHRAPPPPSGSPALAPSTLAAAYRALGHAVPRCGIPRHSHGSQRPIIAWGHNLRSYPALIACASTLAVSTAWQKKLNEVLRLGNGFANAGAIPLKVVEAGEAAKRAYMEKRKNDMPSSAQWIYEQALHEQMMASTQSS